MRRFVYLLLFLSALGTTRITAQVSDYHNNPDFKKVWAQAQQESKQGNLFWAVDFYHKANKKAGGVCVECLSQAVHFEFQMAKYDDVIKDSKAMIALSSGPEEKSMDEFNLAHAIDLKAGDKPKQEQLEQADELYRAAIKDDPKFPDPYYMDGIVLAHLKQDDAARAVFRRFITVGNINKSAYAVYQQRAAHFADDIDLARQKMAPPFNVTTLNGRPFSLDAMNGKVVLIDFWATWCGPCVEELPHMKKLAQEHINDPFVLISISWDSDDKKWRDFIAKNDMTWMQYRDADQSLTKSFAIDAIPHYFTIDSDGILQSEEVGSGSLFDGKIRKLIAKAREAENAATVQQALAGQTAPLANQNSTK